MRNFCQNISHSYGQLLLAESKRLKDPSLLEKARSPLESSLQLATSLNREFLTAASHVALGSLESLTNHPKKARIHLNLALKLFERLERKIWQGEVYTRLAELDISQADYKKAHQFLGKARSIFPEAYLRDHMRLDRISYNAYKQQKRYDRALMFFEKLKENEAKVQKSKDEKNFAKMKVEFGLEAEEERNKRLEAEVNLQAAQIKNIKVIRTLAVGICILVLLLLFFAISMIAKGRKLQKLQKQMQMGILNRFLPPSLITDILHGDCEINMNPHQDTITVLFADIVGFTKLTSEMKSHQTIDILDRFMNCMTEEIYTNHGLIDKFIGDAVMVIFSAPQNVDTRQQAEHAIACGQAMVARLIALNDELLELYGLELEMRVGIHQGEALVGVFGTEKRSDYTALGHSVNVASRVEGRAKPGQILFTETVSHHLDLPVVNCGEFQLRGIADPMTLYTLPDEEQVPEQEAS
ncbi:MAG: hypothetical protein HRU19_20030 [Pseudobacteriovorax sp.]|nr:hypothetical protein [Pseudobacteriovorax sp.]